MYLGIDFGTTHTGAAVYDEGQLRYVPLDWKNRQPHLLRSMIYVTRDHIHSLGIEAVRTYLEQDTGRLVRYEDRVVGTVKNLVGRTSASKGPSDSDGPIEIVYDVVVAEDVGALGRLIQSIKTGLGDTEYAGTKIFGKFYTIQELVALILTHVRERSEHALDQDLEKVVLGRPVTFAGNDPSNTLAEQRLREAAQMAGFKEVHFELEPIAAALFYTKDRHQPEDVFVFDFGGGTLDMTVMRVDGEQRHILATHGVVVGGDDIDSAIMQNKVAPYFGTKSCINGMESPFPAHLAGLLERWQTIPTLSRPRHISLIRDAKLKGDNQEGFAALESLILQNYGFSLFQKIERAKRKLSKVTDTQIKMETELIHLGEAITRREMQLSITAEMAAVQRGLKTVIADAGIDPTTINVVVTTGGSSLIPVFQKILKRRFPNAKLVQSDTFGSVTAGLAIKGDGI
ncbi:MAG: Hsp70 family protein, partial [Methylococcales bacterium]|nr:Hsp70 family protein [Methylococcales bacterium]